MDGLEEKFQSQVNLDTPLISLLPGTSDTVRLRWDPFDNAGDNRLRFVAESIYKVPDTNPADNQVSITARVLSKARLPKGKIEAGEAPEDALRREVDEELGVQPLDERLDPQQPVNRAPVAAHDAPYEEVGAWRRRSSRSSMTR